MARRQHQQLVTALDKLKGDVVLIDTQLQVRPSSLLTSTHLPPFFSLCSLPSALTICGGAPKVRHETF